MTFRDRTSEFTQLAQVHHSPHHSKPKRSVSLHHVPFDSKPTIKIFAEKIDLDIFNTSQKLRHLSELAKCKSLFDDYGEKVENISIAIKKDLQSIQGKIEEMEEASHKRFNNQMTEHNSAIIRSLKSKLAEIVVEFTKTLELRTQNLKTQQNRKEKFIGPRSTVYSTASLQSYDPDFANESIAEEDADEVGVMLPLIRSRDELLEQRSNAILSIERTIEELGGLMSRIATMARQQDEVIRRIDMDIDVTEQNVRGAYDSLLNYMSRLSSNRWLYFKVFGILIIFCVILIVFFA